MAVVPYTRRVIEKWLRQGEIFDLVAKLGRPVSPLGTFAPTQEQVSDLLTDVTQAALQLVRRLLLEGEGWDPDGSACLRTYVVGAAVLSFSDVYRKWRRECAAQLPSDELPVDVVDHRYDLERAAELQERLAQIMAAAHREGVLDLLLAKIDGFTYDEIADRVGCTNRAVEGKLGRFLKKLKRGNL